MSSGLDKSAASEYAKAKVDEIRKKFGYSTKENRPIEDPKKGTITRNYIGPSASKTTSIEPVNEYETRIKNIDSLNRKILDVLQTKQNIELATMRTYESDTRRRGSVGFVMQPTKTDFNNLDLEKGKRREELSEITMLGQNVMKNSFGKIEKKNLDLYIPNNKHTTSLEISSSPEKQKAAKKNEILMEIALQQIKSTRKLQPKEEKPGKKESTKLAEKLSQQIAKDQQFRFLQWEFGEWDKEAKWELLQQKFNNNLTIDEVKKIFSLLPEEHNPFFELKEPTTDSCIDNLIQAYAQANQFWDVNVKECCAIEALEKEGFNLKDLDLNKKGFLSIEDVVCFVNVHTGKFFRNRDVTGLIKRFSGAPANEGIKYENFLDKVTK